MTFLLLIMIESLGVLWLNWAVTAATSLAAFIVFSAIKMPKDYLHWLNKALQQSASKRAIFCHLERELALRLSDDWFQKPLIIVARSLSPPPRLPLLLARLPPRDHRRGRGGNDDGTKSFSSTGAAHKRVRNLWLRSLIFVAESRELSARRRLSSVEGLTSRQKEILFIHSFQVFIPRQQDALVAFLGIGHRRCLCKWSRAMATATTETSATSAAAPCSRRHSAIDTKEETFAQWREEEG